MNGPTALRDVDYFVEQGVDVVIEYQYHADYGAVMMSKFREAAIPVIAVDVPFRGPRTSGSTTMSLGRSEATPRLRRPRCVGG